MALADAAKTVELIKTVAHQADIALVASFAILRTLVDKGLLTEADAGTIASEAISMGNGEQRRKMVELVKGFLPSYQPPRFSAFGPGLAPHFGGTKAPLDD